MGIIQLSRPHVRSRLGVGLERLGEAWMLKPWWRLRFLLARFPSLAFVSKVFLALLKAEAIPGSVGSVHSVPLEDEEVRSYILHRRLGLRKPWRVCEGREWRG